jgi:hypothetical protein
MRELIALVLFLVVLAALVVDGEQRARRAAVDEGVCLGIQTLLVSARIRDPVIIQAAESIRRHPCVGESGSDRPLIKGWVAHKPQRVEVKTSDMARDIAESLYPLPYVVPTETIEHALAMRGRVAAEIEEAVANGTEDRYPIAYRNGARMTLAEYLRLRTP